MLKVVDNLATKIEDRDKRIEELVAELEALKISNTASEAELRKLLDTASAVAEEAKQLEGDRAEKMKRLETLVESNGREVGSLQRQLGIKSDQLEISKRAAELREMSLVRERDAAVTKEKQLETTVSKLQEAAKPISRLVVICVDGSASLRGVLDQVKQVYRDLILYLKAKCADAKVAVVLHGSSNMTYEAHTISERSLTFVDGTGGYGTEDYSYCLPEAKKILEKDSCDKNVVIMIGDGEAICNDERKLYKSIDFLKKRQILAHSIVVSNGRPMTMYEKTEMQKLSDRTGGRTETHVTYFRALDDFVGGK